jgi:hypothetical protein
MPRNIAVKSRPRIVATTGLERTILNPSRIDASPSGRRSGREGAIPATRASARRNVATSSAYAASTPAVPISAPAAAGPTSAFALYEAPSTAKAAGSSSAGTRRAGHARARHREREDRPGERREGVQGPQEWLVEQGVRDEPEREQGEQPVRRERHAAAVDRVGDRAAERGEHEVRDELGERDEADRDRRARDRVHLERDRDERGLAAELGHGLREHEPSQVGRAPQRLDVEQVRANPGEEPGRSDLGRCGPRLLVHGPRPYRRVRRSRRRPRVEHERTDVDGRASAVGDEQRAGDDQGLVALPGTDSRRRSPPPWQVVPAGPAESRTRRPPRP